LFTILQSKYFWEYKNASMRAQELGAQGKKEEVQKLCIDQVMLFTLETSRD
jgi:hypothetical protein